MLNIYHTFFFTSEKDAESVTIFLNETVDYNDFNVHVGSDNLVTFISRNITTEKLAKIELLIDDSETITFPMTCLVTQQLKRHAVTNCSRITSLEGCHQYNITVRLVFNDESMLELPRTFITYPSKIIHLNQLLYSKFTSIIV